MRTEIVPEDKMLCGLSGSCCDCEHVFKTFDLNHVLITGQGFEGMEAKRLGQMHKRGMADEGEGYFVEKRN